MSEPPASAGARPSLTAVVLTYNGRALLADMLASLTAQRYVYFRTLVVDNGSSDDTLAWLEANAPHAEVIALPQNIGVTAALNVGVRAAGSELVALFNNDMELDPDFLGELVRVLDEHPEAGSAAPKLLAVHDRGVLDGAGDTFNWGGVGWRRGHGERDVGQYERPQSIFGACGGAALYRRTAFERVGLLDEDFFAFYEDVDWSFRAQLAGFDCRYVPSAVAYHVGSATIGKGETDFTRYHTWRNGIWLVVKDYPLALLLTQLPRVLKNQLGNLLLAARERKLALLLRVWRDATLGLPAVLRKRSAVQGTRTVSTRRLAAIVREGR